MFALRRRGLKVSRDHSPDPMERLKMVPFLVPIHTYVRGAYVEFSS